MEKISVIIPVYNGETYLEECLGSVLKQDYQNLEIILINDGSTDRSALIIEQYRAKDKRIRVHHKVQNEGLGAARNTGISLATGAYILFIDCDDWIDETHISDLYNLLKKTDSDIAICNFTQFIQDENRYNIHISAEDYYEAVYTPQEWFQFQYGVGHNLSACFTVPWAKLYKKGLFEYVLYATDGFGEDDKTTWKLYLVADKIAYMHRSSLIYRLNSASMTQMANPATVFSPQPVFERLAALGMLGFDVSKEVKAYRWRSQIDRDHCLATGDVVGYKNLKFYEFLLDKYKGK